MRSFPAAAGRAVHVRMLLGVLAAATVALTAASVATAAPPGRAYEKVTPAGKGGGEVVSTWHARSSGDAVSYAGLAAFDQSGGGAALLSHYAGVRGPSGWSVIDRNPIVIGPSGVFAALMPQAITADYTRTVATSASPYDPGDTDDFRSDLYMVETAQEFEWLTGDLPAPGLDTDEMAGGGMSADGSHFAFQTVAPFGSTSQPQVFERTGGVTRLVGIASDGSPLPGAVLGGGRAQPGLSFVGTFPEPSTMSTDGSRIFFSDAASLSSGGASARQLYVRENGTSTTQISLSEATATEGDPADADVDFQMATPDGDRVFFMTTSQLTDDATVGGGLYRYDVSSDELTFLSTGSTDPGGAQVLGVARVSDDGSRAYFVARDALGGEGTVGQPNLYLWDDGDLTFVATLLDNFEDLPVWSGFAGEAGRHAKVTPDGSRLVFTSTADLTADEDGGFRQVYLYDAVADELTCVSCPSGTPASPGASLDPMQQELEFNTVPGDITNDGSTILFQSVDALVPHDTNGQPDAYLWVNGDVHLLGSGSVPARGIIGGISDDGRDVFFMTRESLVPVDVDGGENDVYDARIGGGLPDQQRVPAEPCEGEECRTGAASPAFFDPPGTLTLGGAGDAEPPTGFAVRRISPAQRRRLARTGRITIVVRVTEPGRVSARLLARLGRRTRAVDRGSRRARGPGLVRLRLQLSRAAREQLADTGRLRVVLRVSYSEVNRTSAARFTLRRAGGR
jgi:WD40-like Beta Propeller Repeat